MTVTMQYTSFGTERKGRRQTLVALMVACLLFTAPTRGQQEPRVDVPAWVADAVFYQIFPERFANGDTANDPPGVQPWGGRPENHNFFGGDLAGITAKLDHLRDLGVTALYLNPIFVSPSNHKYNTTDYLRIDPSFGDDAAFRALVDACHVRGIRIILDGVFNHTSVDFFAFADVRANGAASAYTGWYTFHGFPVGPPQRPNYDCWWGYGSMPRLSTGNPAVRSYIADVTRKWMGFGIDGWRLDVANEVPHEFWIWWRPLVRSLNPDAYILAEIWTNAAPWLQGDQFDATMNYRFRTAVLDFFAARTASVSTLDSALAAHRAEYPAEVNFALLNLLGSHDTERLLTACKGDVRSVRQALVFQMTYPGAPMVYYGDEIGMAGEKDPGCRGTMVWEPAGQDTAMLSFVRRLIGLRRADPVWSRGAFARVLTDDDARLYVYERTLNGTRGVVVINDGAEAAAVSLRFSADVGRTVRRIWPDGETLTPGADGTAPVTVEPRSASIYLEESE